MLVRMGVPDPTRVLIQAARNGGGIRCIAPLGITRLVMDCDTTGFEPDVSIAKYKSLAGGGFMIIIDRCAEQALTSMGYTPEAIEEIADCIAKHQTSDECELIRDEDRAVVDCANPCSKIGTRHIAPRRERPGHVEMTAWVQPFISSAISKTVNMPPSTSVEEVERIHAWRRSVKAIAVSPDKSKLGQPLSTALPKDLGIEGEAVLDAVAENDVPEVANALTTLVKKMPGKRYGYTQKADLDDHCLYLTVYSAAPGEVPMEIFISTSKEGAAFLSLMPAFSMFVIICTDPDREGQVIGQAACPPS